MQKKPQQKKKGVEQKVQTVTQQIDPFIRALQKKIRNVGKKLKEIVELEGRDNLKPDQIEKINRKQALIQENLRTEQQIELYKAVQKENENYYREQRQGELVNVAKAIVVQNFHNLREKFSESNKISAFYHALLQEEPQDTLGKAVDKVTNVLIQFANDQKLIKKLNHFVELNLHCIEEEPVQPKQELMVKTLCDDKPKIQLVPVVQTQQRRIPPIVEANQQNTNYIAEKHVAPPAPFIEKPLAEKHVIEVSPIFLIVEEKVVGEDLKKKEDQKQRNNVQTKQRQQKQKPRYQLKQNNFQQKQLPEEQPQEGSKFFNPRQIDQLEDEGFIVVGKPKPKAREQKKIYNKQHGKKYE